MTEENKAVDSKEEVPVVPTSEPFQFDFNHMVNSVLVRMETMVFPILQQAIVGSLKEYFLPALPKISKEQQEAAASANQPTKE